MANFFKKLLKNKDSEDKNLGKQIEMFSYRMKRSMGLTDKDIEKAMDLDITWEIGEYVIYPQHHAWNGWKPILEVLPVDVYRSSNGSGVGWSNVSHNPLPDGWTYIPKGTCTKVLPPTETQNDVIHTIEEFSTKDEILN